MEVRHNAFVEAFVKENMADSSPDEVRRVDQESRRPESLFGCIPDGAMHVPPASLVVGWQE